MHFQLDPKDIRAVVEKWMPDDTAMEAVGVYMKNLVTDRFTTHGASGGQPWAPKKTTAWGFDDGRAILTGRSGGLLESFFSYGEKNAATVASDAPYAHVHELGTRGAGGELPDITPKTAKMLFVPLNDRAARAPRYDKSLVQGHFKDGKVVPANADFVLLRSSKIPPRPMLPTSDGEVEKIIDFTVRSLRPE